MTTLGVLRALHRLWFVLATGLVATAVTVVVVHAQPRAWYAQMDVRFFIPVSEANPNVIQSSSSTLVQVAAIVRDRLDHGHVPPGSTLSLTVQGGRHRDQVSLPNDGSQFVPIYDEPILQLEATGDTRTEVTDKLDQVAGQIRAQTSALQDQSRVARVNRITTKLEPAQPQLQQLHGRTVRSLASIGVIGLLASMWTTLEVDRWIRRQRTRRGLPPRY